MEGKQPPRPTREKTLTAQQAVEAIILSDSQEEEGEEMSLSDKEMFDDLTKQGKSEEEAKKMLEGIKYFKKVQAGRVEKPKIKKSTPGKGPQPKKSKGKGKK